jgi:hypothetical protein
VGLEGGVEGGEGEWGGEPVEGLYLGEEVLVLEVWCV